MSGLFSCLVSDLDFKRTHIESHLSSITSACRDTCALLHAKELVPLGQILQDNLDVLDDETNYKDNLLPLLVDWFSSDFFKWFEKPACERCSSTLGFHKRYVNPENKLVESYVCDKDGFEFLFVRHNEPAILLYTRTGRCGEWAMCFFMILRAMDYHARIVYDTTDHVWNEVWSETKNQFIHVDPCENTVDSPLLYEAGWQKQLEYCIAIGQYELQDVTKRYAIDFDKTLTRRNKCGEAWLSQYLDQMTSELIALAPSDELRSTISKRRSQDIEFINQLSKSPRQIPDRSQLAGRKTGSVQWRISRGEYQISAKNSIVIKVSSTMPVIANSSSIFALYYNCDKNVYRSTANDYDNLPNWSSIVYEYENLDFKYERDWKTSYIARYESCPHNKSGKIRWRFDLSNITDLGWQKVEIVFTGKLYPNTSISIRLTGYKSKDCTATTATKDLLLNESVVIERTELGSEMRYLDIFVVLSGGFEGDEVAWQKPQLFRQTRSQNEDQSAFSIRIY